MTLFWMITAGLTFLAMAFVALPLLRKNVNTGVTSDELNLAIFKQQLAELDNDLEAGILEQARYDAARTDLEKELLTDIDADQEKQTRQRKSGQAMAAVALLVPIAALTIYQVIGFPDIISRLGTQTAATGMPPHGSATGAPGQDQGLPPMEVLVERLAAKLKEQPDNLEGWIILGRSYMTMNNYPAAIEAYKTALNLDDQNVNLLLAYGEALAASHGNDFTGQAAPLIQKAYTLAPQDPNVLWLNGVLAYQSNQFQQAIDHWQGLRSSLTPQSSELESVNAAIDDARSQLGLGPEEPELPSIVQAGGTSSSPAAPKSPATSNSGIQVEIALSPELAARAKPDDLVFIYAKALNGPPMPLAALRKQVRDLPLSVQLDDSMAMMPQMKLSGFDQVQVGARVSLSGNPTAQSGDLEGVVKPVKPGQSEQVKVLIDTVHP
ncbi:MAG: c-type cytochrome biogenesis protein CcmI [Candidatus Thiodiazotropha sp.]